MLYFWKFPDILITYGIYIKRKSPATYSENISDVLEYLDMETAWKSAFYWQSILKID